MIAQLNSDYGFAFMSWQAGWCSGDMFPSSRGLGKCYAPIFPTAMQDMAEAAVLHLSYDLMH